MQTFYRLLLLAYPKSLRDAHGAEMTTVFAERWAADGPGFRRRLRLFVLLIFDFVISLPGAWRGAGGRPPGSASGPSRGNAVSTLLSDIRVAVRHLLRSPLFTAGTILILGCGIGATTAVFSLADATLLRPLPIPDADRVLQTTFSWSMPDFRDLERDQQVFSRVAAWSGFDIGVDHADQTTLVSGLAVSSGFFDLTGLDAERGRLLGEVDDRPGAPVVAVISARLWDRVFGRDPALVGSVIRLNQRPVTVVGIAPGWFRGFSLRERPEIFVAFSSVPTLATGFLARPTLQTSRNAVWLQVAGLLEPGIAPETARAATEQLYRRAHPVDEASNRIPEPVTLVPITARALGLESSADLTRFLTLLLSATAICLLLTCAAVASLLTVRTRGRRREFAIRSALGGGRLRVTRLLLVESVAIGLGGAMVGLGTAQLMLSVLGAFELPGRIVIGDLGAAIDFRMLVVAAGAGLLTSVIFGMAPMWQASRVPAAEALGEGARGASRRPIGSALVALQVAVSVVLLGGSFAFGQAIQQALGTDLGFRTDTTAMLTVEPGIARRSTAELPQFYEDVLELTRAHPAVADAAWAKLRPFSGMMVFEAVAVGFDPPTGPDIADRAAETNLVTAGYFDTLGIGLRAGRAFDDRDRADGERVVVVSESMVQRFWNGQNPVGRQLSTFPLNDPTQLHTVIGVVDDIQRGLSREKAPTMYLLASQHGDMLDFGGSYLYVRAPDGSSAGQALTAGAAAIARVDRAVPITNRTTLEEGFRDTLLAQRLGLTLFALFAALALGLTGLGLYAVVAYAVAFRRREIGIRVALGAQAGPVLRLVCFQGLLPVAAGLLLGLGGLTAASAPLERFLSGTTVASPATYLALAMSMCLLAAIATAVPVRRALRIDPTVALRDD